MPTLLHRTLTTLPLFSARDVPTGSYSSSPSEDAVITISYDLMMCEQWTSGFIPPVCIKLQQGAQRTACLGSSCTPALLGACPSHGDFCKLPRESSTGSLNQFHVFQTRGPDLPRDKCKPLSASVPDIISLEQTD